MTSAIGAVAAYRAGNVLLGRGLAFGLVAELLAVGMNPVALFRQEPGFATMLLLCPLVAGAVAGAIVGRRPAAVVEGRRRDERAEDALVDRAD